MEGGAGDSYQVRLTTTPDSNVMVTISVDGQLDIGGGVGQSVDLTFTPGNALVPQLVTVSAFDDSAEEGVHFSTIAHTASSLDSEFDGIPVEDVIVTIVDNDVTAPSIVITEIMYNPDSDETSPGVAEWVEIANSGNATVDLGGWKLDDEDNTDWSLIPSGSILLPGQVAVLFDVDFTSTTEFRNAWSVPDDTVLLGLDWGSLANSPSSTNEVLQLVDPDGTVMDEVNYDDSGAWPSDSTDGPSISLIDVHRDNNVGENWQRSALPSPFTVSAAGIFSNQDIGSPGYAPGLTPTGDFDRDGVFGCADVDSLVSEIASTADRLAFDLTGDGRVDVDDLDAWLAIAGSANLGAEVAYLRGDANLDGLVDGSDFNAWNANKYAADRGWCGADFNADGFTDGSDFNVWNANKFQVANRNAVGLVWSIDNERHERDDEAGSKREFRHTLRW